MTIADPQAAPRPARIKKLTVRHFKSINGTLDVKLDGKNVVVLGENGSGKTSLTRALAAVLDASRRQTNAERAKLFERCIYADQNSEPGFITLELENGATFTLKENGEWESRLPSTVRPAGLAVAWPPPVPVSLAETAKAKRILDYKALLRTYFLHGTPVDLFELLISDILPNEENTLSGRTYGEDWAELERLHKIKPRIPQVRQQLNTVIRQLNDALTLKLVSVVMRAQPLLAAFDPRLSFDVSYGALVRTKRTEKMPTGYARLQVLRDREPIDRHTEFLNEARLSAIALCLHFAVLLDAPRTALGVLVLDDVLIGLDMENRKPTLDLLDRQFASWQTCMLTYDSQWFDSVREWSQSRDWLCLKLHRSDEFDQGITLLDKGQGLLGDAKRLLRSGDLSSAANATRSALETILKRHFEKNDVSMPFTRKLKDLSLDQFWKKAKTLHVVQLDGMAKVVQAPQVGSVLLINDELERRVNGARALILNPMSHDPNLPWTTPEVREAMEAVKLLAVALAVQNP